MELKNISTMGLLKAREKYAKALVTRNVVWSYCSICVEVLPRHSCEQCPLFGPRWCRSSPVMSRLHPDFHYNINRMGVSGLDYKLEWERDVTIFLKWITTELVSRGAGVFEFD